MLTEPKLTSLHLLVQQATREELIWINGYVNGLLNNPIAGHPDNYSQLIAEENAVPEKFTILYGTETGNSQKLAFDFGARIKAKGISSKIKSMDQYRLSDLGKETNLLLVVSTHGEGDPPAAARKFFDHIHNDIPSLENLKYSVFALGDSAYPLFCKAGEDLDNRFHSLGAKRITTIGKADTDFKTHADVWIETVLHHAVSRKAAPEQLPSFLPNKSISKKYHAGTITTKINLNDLGSQKETWHIEIETEEILNYEPGDAIGIIASNKESDVDLIVQLLGVQHNNSIIYRQQEFTIGALLKSKLNLHHLPDRIIQSYAILTNREIPDTRMDFTHLLKIYPPEKTVILEQLLGLLEPITPRLYSIASSATAQGYNEVHVTVARNSFFVNNQKQYGFCSDYLSALAAGDEFEFYIHKNNAFKLPEQDKDIILIGPGTGIAPFRSFLLEREANGASGKNWLFFGEQHFATDFLYQTEIQSFLQTGVLTKFNAAFSRDQQDKIYVQHRMQQHASTLFEWIQGGAHIYICGAKDPMSKDVEQTLLEIISNQLNETPEKAANYLNSMKEQGRYHVDVY